MSTIQSGKLREVLIAQLNDPPVLSVTGITRASTTATVTTAAAHGFVATDYVTIAGCDGATTGYNAKWKIVTVPTSTTFTFTCNGTLTTPATGTITVVYTSNAQGGLGQNFWRTLSTDYGEYLPLKSYESLQLRALQSDTTGRFRVHAASKWNETLRLTWTPSWPPGSARQTLTITGVIRDPDDIAYQLLDVAQVTA